MLMVMETENSEAEELRQLEWQLIQPDVRARQEAVGNLLAEEFLEFGSSGRIFDRRETIELLRQEQPVDRTMTRFQSRSLAPGIALVTYHLKSQGKAAEGPILSLRSSIWKRIDGRWRMIFHQGTRLTPR